MILKILIYKDFIVYLANYTNNKLNKSLNQDGTGTALAQLRWGRDTWGHP